MDIKEIIDSQEYIDIVMSILEITGEKLTERNLMSDQYLREDIKKAAIEGEVLYNFLKELYCCRQIAYLMIISLLSKWFRFSVFLLHFII